MTTSLWIIAAYPIGMLVTFVADRLLAFLMGETPLYGWPHLIRWPIGIYKLTILAWRWTDLCITRRRVLRGLHAAKRRLETQAPDAPARPST